MTVPLDAIRAFHNAFRKDMAAMDSAARSAARGRDIPDLVLQRYAFFNEMLAWHASGEEHYVFTALETVAPNVAEAYQRDHRGLDSLSESLTKAVETKDPMAIALATGEYNFFSTFHLNKEEAHLYRIFNERIPVANQGSIIGKMSQEIPQPRFPEVVSWLYPLIGHDDRENMVRIFQQVLPKPVFTMATGIIRESIGSDWAELTRRVPELKETI
jgi:hypothetical protein